MNTAPSFLKANIRPLWTQACKDDAPFREAVSLAEGEKFRAIYDVVEPAADRGRRAVVL